MVKDGDKKYLIAKAVKDLIVERGTGDFSVEEISRKAGIGKGTIYLYFRSKDEIFIYTIIFYLDKFVEELHREVEEFDDPRDKLRLIFRFHADYVRKTHLFWEAIFNSLSLKDPRKWGEKEFFRVRSKLIGVIEDIVREGVEMGVFRGDLPMESLSRVIFMVFRSIGSFLGFDEEFRIDEKKVNQFLATLEEVVFNGISASDN